MANQTQARCGQIAASSCKNENLPLEIVVTLCDDKSTMGKASHHVTLIFLALSPSFAVAQYRESWANVPRVEPVVYQAGPRRHTSSVTGISISPNNQLIMSREYGLPRIWNLQSGELISKWDSVSMSGQTVFSPDSQSIYGISNYQGYYNVDVLSGEMTRLYGFEEGSRPSIVNTSRDGKRLLFNENPRNNRYDDDWRGGRSRNMGISWYSIREQSTGKIISRIFDAPDAFSHAQITPDGRQVVTLATNNAIKLWDVETGRILRQMEPSRDVERPNRNSNTNIVFNRDGRLVAVARNGRGVAIYRMDDSTKLHWWDLSTSPAFPMTFTPDDQGIYAAIKNGDIGYFNFNNGDMTRVFAGHVGSVASLAVTSDGRTLVSGGADGTLRIWNALTGEERDPPKGHVGEGILVGWGYRNQWFASAGQDGTVRIRDPKTGAELVPPFMPSQRQFPVNLLAVHPREPVVAFPSATGVVTEWNWSKRQVRQLHYDVSFSPHELRYSQDGSRLYIQPDNKSIAYWTYPEGRFTAHSIAIGSIEKIAIHPRPIAIVNQYVKENQTKLIVWDFETDKKLYEHNFADINQSYYESNSPDGKWFIKLVGGDNGRNNTIIHDLKSMTPRYTLPIASYEKNHNQYTSDGRYAIFNDEYSNYYVLEMATGTPLVQFETNARGTSVYALASDLSCVISVMSDGSFKHFPLQPVTPTTAPTDTLWQTWWNDMQNGDGKVALSAIRGFVANPARAIAFLRQHISTPNVLSEADLKNLVKEMDSPVFAVRQAALNKLKISAGSSNSVIQRYLPQIPSQEIRKLLIRHLKDWADEEFVPIGATLRERRAVQVLEWIGTQEAEALLASWSQSPGDSYLARDSRESYTRLTGKKPPEAVKPVLTPSR